MRRRFVPFLAVAAASIAFGASPALAATQCHTAPPPPSAVNVYVQQVPTSGACPQNHPHHSTTQPNGQPSNEKPNNGGPSVPVKSSAPRKNTAHSHPPAQGLPVIKTSPLSSPPSAVSAAFDLGFGPTALFAALLAAAALLAVGGGLRHGRR
jgi:hypothetical protein